jgi:hypothetical protein
MKSKVFLFFLISAVALLTGCNKEKVNIQSGSGAMMYNGIEYPFDFSTSTTFPSGDKYTHSVTFTSTKNGNAAFSFTVKDENPEEGIIAKNYEISLNSDYTAHFSIEGTGDYLEGTMKVSVSGDIYTFDFSGITTDENTETKTMEFTYTGKIENS